MVAQFEGDLPKRSLAAAAAGRGELRLGNSFRFQEARGAFCHAGWCQQCKVRLADGRVGLACRLSAEELPLLVPPSRLRRLIGIIARRNLRPWFHERVLVRLPFFQTFFLGLVRRASGALPLAAAYPGKPQIWKQLSCRTVVVGGGRSGQAAAVQLCELGHEVILVDEGQAGGRALPSVPGLRVFANTTALGLYPDSDAASGFHLLCSGAGKNLQVSFERLVVATGAYTRLPLVPGSTTPGVISLPAYERVAGDRASPKGTRVCVFGPGWALRRAAMAAAEAGSQIVMALGGDDLDASLSRRIAPGAYPERIEGGDRVRRVTLGDGSRIECDLMVVAYEQPSYELQMQAGQRIALRGLGHPLETEGETPFPMLVVGRASGGDAAAADAGAAVEGWLAGRKLARRDSAVMPHAEIAQDAAVLCPCEDVTVGDIRAAVRDGFDNVEHVKRRTGAGTGPCQGKLCHAAFVGTLVRCGVPAAIPTVRPLCRPACLGDFSDASHG